MSCETALYGLNTQMISLPLRVSPVESEELGSCLASNLKRDLGQVRSLPQSVSPFVKQGVNLYHPSQV